MSDKGMMEHSAVTQNIAAGERNENGALEFVIKIFLKHVENTTDIKFVIRVCKAGLYRVRRQLCRLNFLRVDVIVHIVRYLC